MDIQFILHQMGWSLEVVDPLHALVGILLHHALVHNVNHLWGVLLLDFFVFFDFEAGFEEPSLQCLEPWAFLL